MRVEQAFQTPLVCVQCLNILSLDATLSWHRPWAAWSEAAGYHQPTATALPLPLSKEYLDTGKIWCRSNRTWEFQGVPVWVFVMLPGVLYWTVACSEGPFMIALIKIVLWVCSSSKGKSEVSQNECCAAAQTEKEILKYFGVLGRICLWLLLWGIQSNMAVSKLCGRWLSCQFCTSPSACCSGRESFLLSQYVCFSLACGLLLAQNDLLCCSL